jgi:hypothetical protein
LISATATRPNLVSATGDPPRMVIKSKVSPNVISAKSSGAPIPKLYMGAS